MEKEASSAARGTSHDRSIDWARVAEPQRDGYDTEIVLAYAVAAGYRRREPAPGTPRLLEAAIDQTGAWLGATMEPAPIDHPNIARRKF